MLRSDPSAICALRLPPILAFTEARVAAPSVVTMFRLPPVFRAAWSVVVRDSVWLKLAESGASLAALKLEFDPVPFVSGLEEKPKLVPLNWSCTDVTVTVVPCSSASPPALTFTPARVVAPPATATKLPPVVTLASWLVTELLVETPKEFDAVGVRPPDPSCAPTLDEALKPQLLEVS